MSEQVPTKKKLDDVAKCIQAHLNRFEADPAINTRDRKHGTSRFYHAGAWRGGSRVSVSYISYQGSSTMTREQAERYLQWLDAGNVGRHWEALKETV